jgi:hypothetical protein
MSDWEWKQTVFNFWKVAGRCFTQDNEDAHRSDDIATYVAPLGWVP